MLSIKTLIARVLQWTIADIPSNNVMNVTCRMGSSRAWVKSGLHQDCTQAVTENDVKKPLAQHRWRLISTPACAKHQ